MLHSLPDNISWGEASNSNNNMIMLKHTLTQLFMWLRAAMNKQYNESTLFRTRRKISAKGTRTKSSHCTFHANFLLPMQTKREKAVSMSSFHSPPFMQKCIKFALDITTIWRGNIFRHIECDGKCVLGGKQQFDSNGPNLTVADRANIWIKRIKRMLDWFIPFGALCEMCVSCLRPRNSFQVDRMYIMCFSSYNKWPWT